MYVVDVFLSLTVPDMEVAINVCIIPIYYSSKHLMRIKCLLELKFVDRINNDVTNYHICVIILSIHINTVTYEHST